MPNFNARVLEDDLKADGTAPIKIRVTHRGQTRRISTDYSIDPKLFDNKKGRAKPEYANYQDLNIELQVLELTYQRKTLKLEGRIHDISMDDLIQFIKDTDKLGQLDLFVLGKKNEDFMRSSGKTSSASIMKGTMDRVAEYISKRSISITSVTPQWLKGFESWYKVSRVNGNPAPHLRNLRTLFNVAINDYGMSRDLYPFNRFQITEKKVLHRDLLPTEIAAVLNYHAASPTEERARDLFLLSFYLCGINFKDLIHLKRTDLRRGRLLYSRAKTDTPFTVLIQPEAQALINKYKGDKYLLSIMESKISAQEKKNRTTPLYKDVTDQTNRVLKRIAKKINKDQDGKDLDVVDPDLSTYYARHSWASIAAKCNVSHDVIREALGHSRTVTDRYINFYVQKIDEANRKVIDAVMEACRQDVQSYPLTPNFPASAFRLPA